MYCRCCAFGRSRVGVEKSERRHGELIYGFSRREKEKHMSGYSTDFGVQRTERKRKKKKHIHCFVRTFGMQVAEKDVDEKKRRKESERRIYTFQCCVCTLSSLEHHHAQHTHHPISITATHHIQTHTRKRHPRINPIITSCDKIARHLLHMSAYHTLHTKNSMARPTQVRRPAHTKPPKTTREWSHIIIP
jgi:hypothetical protein